MNDPRAEREPTPAVDAPGGPPPRDRRALAPTLVVAAAILLGVLWPVIRSNGFGEHDAAFSAAQMGWVQQVVVHGGALWDAPLGYPGTDGTTRADWVLVQALLTLPWRAAGPEIAWSAATLLGLLMTALGAAFVGRRLLGDGPQLLPAILVLAVGPAVMPHLAHPNLLYTGIGLFAAGLAVGTRREAFAAGLLVAVAFHAGLYTGLRAAALVGAVLAARRDLRAIAAAALGFGLLVPTLVPVYRHYAAAGSGQWVDAKENLDQSVDVSQLWGADAGPGLPGVVLTAIGLGGLWLRRRSAPWRWLALGAAACFLLALGSPLQFGGHPTGLSGPWILLDLLSGHRLRGPERWLVYVHLALALGAGAALLSVPSRWRWPAALALSAALVAESPHPHRSAAPRWTTALTEAAAALPGDAPLWNIPGHDDCAGGEYVAALALGRPLAGGTYARFDAALSEPNRLARTWPAPPAVAWAQKHGVLVVEHPPLRGEDPSGFTCVRAAGHRLCTAAAALSAPPPSARP